MRLKDAEDVRKDLSIMGNRVDQKLLRKKSDQLICRTHLCKYHPKIDVYN